MVGVCAFPPIKQTTLHRWGTHRFSAVKGGPPVKIPTSDGIRRVIFQQFTLQMSGSMHFDLKAFTAFSQAPIGNGI